MQDTTTESQLIDTMFQNPLLRSVPLCFHCPPPPVLPHFPLLSPQFSLICSSMIPNTFPFVPY